MNSYERGLGRRRLLKGVVVGGLALGGLYAGADVGVNDLRLSDKIQKATHETPLYSEGIFSVYEDPISICRKNIADPKDSTQLRLRLRPEIPQKSPDGNTIPWDYIRVNSVPFIDSDAIRVMGARIVVGDNPGGLGQDLWIALPAQIQRTHKIAGRTIGIGRVYEHPIFINMGFHTFGYVKKEGLKALSYSEFRNLPIESQPKLTVQAINSSTLISSK